MKRTPKGRRYNRRHVLWTFFSVNPGTITDETEPKGRLY